MKGFVWDDGFRVVPVFESEEVIEGCDLVALTKRKRMLRNINIGGEYGDHLLLQDINHLAKVPRKQVASRNVRDCVHDFILICQLDVHAVWKEGIGKPINNTNETKQHTS
jgi:hypothetical protein